MRALLGTLLLALAGPASGAPAPGGTTGSGATDGGATGSGARAHAYTARTLDLAARLPVQDDGRVKPLSTLAAFTLLRLHHRRGCEDATGHRLEPIEWLLDVWLFPEEANAYPLFRVESHEAVQAAGLPTEGKRKRDLYSYDELRPGREKLISLAHSYASIDAKQRTPLQGQVVNLGQALVDYEHLAHFLDFARAEVDVHGVPPFGGGDELPRARFSEILAEAPAITAALQETGPDPARTRASVDRMLAELSPLARDAAGVRLFAPASDDPDAATWTNPGELASHAFLDGPPDPRHLELVAALERLVDARESPERLEARMTELSAGARALAAARGEAGKVDLEVGYYALDPFYRALVVYLLAFLAMAATWLRPKLRRTYRVALGATGAALALHVAGIVVRCVLRGRPPVSTLYETVIFVGAIAVGASLFMERVDRRRLAGSLAPALGALSLFIAMKFEELQGVDTMPQLVAVLDTNFWLSTHVTCITMGYSAGLLASAFAHLYVLGKVFGIRGGDDAGYREVARMVYGTLCFALIFSVVGTILGGVWANESWGRFWGWDPKENGALMIVLAQLAILHARMGGYLKAFGIALAVILQGTVVAFSWWGVNLLGVGLHSYGFTDGIWRALLSFYVVEGGVVLLGASWWAQRRWISPRAKT